MQALDLPAVRITLLEFDSKTATASLEWTAYSGPRFDRYEVRRSTAGQSEVVAEFADLARTALVDSWDLDGDLYWIRLYREPGNRITALALEDAPDETAVQVYVFDADGSLLEHHRPFDVVPIFGAAFIGDDGLPELPQVGDLLASAWGFRVLGMGFVADGCVFCGGTSMALDAAGRRIYSFGQKGALLVAIEPDGRPIEQRIELFTEELALPLAGEEAVVEGEILLRGDFAIFDNVSVSSAGNVLFSEDFSAFPEGELAEGPVDGWDLQGPVFSANGRISPLTADGGARRRDDAWENFRLECDVFSKPPGSGIQIGGDTYSRFFLHLDKDRRSRATLEWTFTPPPGSDLPARQDTFVTNIPIEFPETTSGETGNVGIPVASRLSLEMVEGRLRVSIVQRVFWHGGRGDVNSIAAIGDALMVTAFDRWFAVTGEGEGTRRPDLDSFVAETRAWTVSNGAQKLGICLPELGQLRIGTVRNPRVWDTFLTTQIGPSLKKRGRSLQWPISFDFAPDGRIYVLDASVGVVSIDEDGTYITSWGADKPSVDIIFGPV